MDTGTEQAAEPRPAPEKKRIRKPRRPQLGSITERENGYLCRVVAEGRRYAKYFPKPVSMRRMRDWIEGTKESRKRDRYMRELRTILDHKAIPKNDDGWCYVYIAECQGQVKIGRTTNLQQRFREIGSTSPEGLQLLVAMPAHANLEKLLHRRFEKNLTHHEWFTLDDDLRGFIQAVKAGRCPLTLLFGDEKSYFDFTGKCYVPSL